MDLIICKAQCRWALNIRKIIFAALDLLHTLFAHDKTDNVLRFNNCSVCHKISQLLNYRTE